MRHVERGFYESAYPETIARQGEHMAVTLNIDAARILAHYPGAYFPLMIRRGCETSYIASDAMDIEGGIASYTLTGTDTARAGDLLIEAQVRDADGRLLKSVTHRFFISPSLEPCGEPPEPPEPGWVDNVLDAARDAREAAGDASDAADEARGYADDAREYADMAANGFLGLVMSIDENGWLVAQRVPWQIDSVAVDDSGDLVFMLEVA